MRVRETGLAVLAFILAACASTSTLANEAARASSDASRAPIDKSTHAYATRADQVLQLDRYVARTPQSKGKRPVLIYSVGGGWEVADRADRVSVDYLEHFASLGYVAVSIDYRLAIKQAKQRGELSPANIRETYLRAIRWGVEDLLDATAYVLKHADEWNADPARIVIVGSSAGATNSLVAEFNVANQTELAKAHLPADFRYAGVISMAGAFWLENDTPFDWKRPPAPIMFVHGGKDQLVTYDADVKNSAYGPVYAHRQFASRGYSSWFIDLPEADHTMSFAGLVDYRSEMEAFLAKLVWDRQDLSIHTVETGKITKTFGNVAALYRRYLPPELLKALDGAKQQATAREPMSASADEKPEEVLLWPGPAPGGKPLPAPETRVVNDKTWRPFIEIHNVSAPSFTVIRPAAGTANGAGMVVLPGGAFGILAWDLEGTEVAQFLAKRGITAFVLKYRVSDPSPEEIKAFLADPTNIEKALRSKRDLAVQDAMQAIRILRADASKYGIDPDRIGMMGFSAGAITTLAVLQQADDSTRPNFAAPIYGMGFEPDVPAKAPPLFMAVAKDDTMMATASAEIQKAWQAAGKSAELHVLESGGHGFGLGRPGTDSTRFPELLEAWLRRLGYVTPTS